eukprot:g353.t1
MPGPTSALQGSPKKDDIEQSPLVVADGNALDMPQLDLDDGSVETTEKDAESNKGMVPMAIETDANTENLAGKGESKCLGKYEYGTKPWHIFMYAPEIYKADKAQLLNEVAAGLTVAFAQVSESVAFAFIAGARNDKRSHRRTCSLPFFLDPQYTNDLPPLSWEVVGIVIFPAFIASAAGAVEAVMTMEVVNDLTETTNEAPNQQLIALSIGNFISGIYGTMGGGATIGLSVINCTSGANGIYRLSGIIAGIAVLVFILVASPFIEALPTASLVGVMVIVIHGTFDWESLQIIFTTFMPLRIRDIIDRSSMTFFGKKVSFSGSRKIKRTDAITIILVTVVTLVQDLFVAVALGIVFTATAFSWEIGSDCYVDFEDVTDSSGKVVKRIYHMHGPLFFASAQRFVTFFNPKTDPDLIEVNFMEQGAVLDDFSAIHALNVVGEKYGKYDKKVVVRYLKFKSQKRAEKASKLIKSFSIESGEAAENEQQSSEAKKIPSEDKKSGFSETKSSDVAVEVEASTSVVTMVETHSETLPTDEVHRQTLVSSDRSA